MLFSHIQGRAKLLYLFLFITITQGVLMSATIKQIKCNNTKVPVVFEKFNTLPIFNLQLVFTNSGYIKDANKPGITNITAKILNEGTKKDGSVKFARKLENDAISIETSAGFETFVIEVSCLTSEYKTALKYLKQLLQDPNITKQILSKIQGLQLSKLEQKQNDFDYVASKELLSITYKNTPLEYGRDGDVKTIANLTTEDINKQFSSIMNLDNLIVLLGGDIKYQEAKDQIKDIINTIKPQGNTKLQHIDMNNAVSQKITKKQTQQSYIYFSSPFDIKYNSKDSYKAKVASFILGGSGFGSRLMEEIRVKNGLAYSAYGQIANKKSHSNFTGYLQTKLDNTKKAKDMVVSIVDNFVKDGATQKELDAAKDFLSGSEPLRTETFSQRQNRAFGLYYKGLSFDYPKKELELINSLTLEELNDFIKSHKEIKKLSFSVVTK